MAKKSAVNRNEAVKALVAKHAAKRASLKAIANDESKPLEERFEARLKLAAMPRNGAATRKRSSVLTPASKLRQRVLDVLADEGYIRGYKIVENPGEFPQFEIELKYFDGQPVIAEISRVSKPGRRVYSSIGDLKPIKNGLGISILSTSKGVMSDAAARDANVGGEVLCKVY